MEYRTGDVIGAYRLLEQCGKGSFGQVFLAENLFSGQTVALKLLTGTGKAMQKELDGLIRFRSCRHPNLLPILHIDKVDNHLYYTMPPADNLTPGEGYSADTLAHRLSSQGRLPASEVMAMAMELLAGLKELHRYKLMHRDIKPDNILWLNRQAVLADVGLIGNDSDAGVCGSPGFMPEEVLSGLRKATAADDLHALGKVIYCALTGLGAEEFPRLPGKFSDPVAKRLFRAVCVVCSKSQPIQKVEDFQNLLRKFDDNRRKRIILFAGIVLTAIITTIALTEWRTSSFGSSEIPLVMPLPSRAKANPEKLTSSSTSITAPIVSLPPPMTEQQPLPLPQKPFAVEYPMPIDEYPLSVDAERLRDSCIIPYGDQGFSNITTDPLDIAKENNSLNEKFLQIQRRYTPELRAKCDKRCAEIEKYRSRLSFDPDRYAKEIREFEQQHYYSDVLYLLSQSFHRSFLEGGDAGRFLKHLPRPEYKQLMPGRLFNDLFDYISAHESLDRFAYLLDFYDAHYLTSK